MMICYYFYMNYMVVIGVKYLKDYQKDQQNIYKNNLKIKD